MLFLFHLHVLLSGRTDLFGKDRNYTRSRDLKARDILRASAAIVSFFFSFRPSSAPNFYQLRIKSQRFGFSFVFGSL